MAYRTFDINGKEITQHDLQDKGPWCLAGASFEEVFIKKFGEGLGLTINPEKSMNPYAPDLINFNTNNLGDLKTQNTPFFQSKVRYNIDPQYAVTFNVKDYRRYKEYYPNIEIYFWVSWVAIRFEGASSIKVNEMEGIWSTSLSKIELMIQAGAPVHSYSKRVSDTLGNAKESYVFDLQNKPFTKIK